MIAEVQLLEPVWAIAPILAFLGKALAARVLSKNTSGEQRQRLAGGGASTPGATAPTARKKRRRQRTLGAGGFRQIR